MYRRVRRRKRLELRDSAYFLGKTKEQVNKERGRSIRYLHIGRGSVRVVVVMICLISVVVGLVSADDFYPDADGWDCEFGYAESVSIHSLPSSQNLPGGLQYNSNLIVGEGANFPQRHEMDDVVEFNYPYSRRMLGVADRVSVPPGARVDVGYFVRNYSGHHINTNGGWLFLTKTGGGGDWTRLGAHGWQNKSVVLVLDGDRITKSGRAVWIGNLGNWPDHDLSDLPKGWTIYTFRVSQPMVFDGQSTDYHFDQNGNLIVDMSVTLRNTSSYRLSNVRYSHASYSVTRSFEPGQTRTFNYSRNMGKNYSKSLNLGFGRVTDPNSQNECIVIGTDFGDNDNENNPNRWMLFSFRDDSDSPDGWWGIQAEYPFRPEGSTMCVERIPYSLNSQVFRLELESELSLDSVISDTDEFRLKEVNSIIREPIEIEVLLKNSGARADNLCTSLDFDSGKLEIVNSCGGLVEDGVITWDLERLQYNSDWKCVVEAQVKDLDEPVDELLVNMAKGGDDGVCNLEAETRINLESSVEISLEKTVSHEIVKYGDQIEFNILLTNNGNGLVDGAVMTDECSNCDGLIFDGFRVRDVDFGEDFGFGKGIIRVVQLFHVSDEFIGPAKNCVRVVINEEEYNDCVHVYLDESLVGGNNNGGLSPIPKPILNLGKLSVSFNPQDIVSRAFQGMNLTNDYGEDTLVKTGFEFVGLLMGIGVSFIMQFCTRRLFPSG